MRTMRAGLAGLVIAGGAVLAVPGTAHACSCVSGDPKQFVDWADAVVWARVADADVPATGMGEAHYLLDVERVYKGEVTERAQVDSDASGAACGLEGIRAGRRYAFFLNGDGSPWSANLCGGTGSVVEEDRLEKVAAPGDASRSAGRVPEPGGPDRLPVSGVSYAGIGAGALAASVGAAVLWRRRRSSGAA